MKNKDSTAAQHAVETSELTQLLHRIHELEARIAELETDVSRLVENDNACIHDQHEPMTIYDFISEGDDAY